MTEIIERRRTPRIDIHADETVRLELRHRVQLLDISQSGALLGTEAKDAMRAGWDPADHHVISPWTTSLVRVAVVDESDPTPAWVISTRRPEALVAAISAARAAR